MSGANVSMSGHIDDDVARLEGRVVLEQVQDRVAQDLDLAGAAVAGVDLDAAVVLCQKRAFVVAGGRLTVGADVGLDAGEEGVAAGVDGVVVVLVRAFGRAQDHLELARVVAPRGEETVGRELSGWVGLAADDRRPVSSSAVATFAQSAGDGCRRKRWTSRPAASPRRTSR